MKRNKVLFFITIFLLSFITVSYAAFSSELIITGEVSVVKDSVAPTCGAWYLRDSSLTTQEAYTQNKFINPGTNTTWSTTNKTLFIECTDNMQGDYGCVNVTEITDNNNQQRYFKDVKNYTTSVKTDSNVITVTLQDAYQNQTTCTLPVGGSNPYIDKQAPTVTITKTAYNKFTYSATDDLEVKGYMVTTSSTQPTIDNPNWVTTPSEVTIDNTAAKTYYVWAKDEVNVTSQTINTYLLTKSQGEGTTLTLKYQNDSGTELSTGYVLSGTPVYVTGSLSTGYINLVLTKTTTSVSVIENNTTQTITEATTITSGATSGSYTVTANANGGTIPSTTGWTGSGNTSTKSVTLGSSYGDLPTPTKDGYTFAGWNGKNMFNMIDFIDTYTPYQSTPAEIVEFQGENVWKVYGSIELEGRRIEYMKGQFESNTQYTLSVDIYDVPNQNNIPGLVFTIKYIGDDTVYYYFNRSTSDYNWANSWVHYSFTTPANKSVECIRFTFGTGSAYSYIKNFQIEEGTTETEYEPYYILNSTNVTIPSNHTIYAKWTPNTYTVTADANGGYIPTTTGWTGIGYQSTKSVTYNTAYGTLPTPTRDGYTFVEWTSKNLFKKQGTLSNGSTGVDVTYDSSTETYTLNGIVERQGNIAFSIGSFDINPGEQITLSVTNTSGTAELASGTGITYAYSIFTQDNSHYIRGNVSPDSFLQKYTFTGNMVSDSGGPNNRVYLQLWRVGTVFNNYKIQIQIERGSTATSFEPHHIDQNTIVTIPNNHTITAEWTPNAYTVTANANGGTIPTTTGWTGIGNTSTKSVTYDSTYGTLPTPTREGYTFAGWSLLPEGYTEVEYIESSGTEYIDTGYIPKTNTKLELDLSFQGSFKDTATYGGSAKFLGVADSNTQAFNINFGSTSGEYNLLYSWFNKKYRYDGQSPETISISNSIRQNRNTLTIENGRIKYDTVSRTISSKESDQVSPMYLFASNNVQDNMISVFTSYNMRVYFMKIYEGSNLMREFVPCIQESTGKAGLYDLITDTFFGNLGTGDFTYGDEVNTYITSSSIVNIPRNHTITAKWEPNVYIVTALANGGSIETTTGWTGTGNNATKAVTYDSEYGTLPTVTRSGYVLAGWNGKNLFNKDSTNRIDSEYVKGDGTVGSTSEYGTYIIDIEPDTTYTITNSGGSTNPGYAIYDSNGNRVGGENYLARTNVTFTTPANSSYMKVSVVTLSSSNRYDKDIFQIEKGSSASAYEPYLLSTSTPVTQSKSHSLTAIWIPNTYTLTADANGGTIPATTGWTGIGNTSTKSVTLDSAYGDLPVPQRTGYTFGGWYKPNYIGYGFVTTINSSNGNVKRFSSESYWSLTDTDIYEVGDVLEFDIDITGANITSVDINDITLNSSDYIITNGSNIKGRVVIDSRMDVVHPYNGDNLYYNFIDICTDGTITSYNVNKFNLIKFDNSVTSSTIVSITSDHSIYAYWTPNTYTLTADANGGTIPSTSGWTGTGNTSTKSVTYNSTYGDLPTPTRDGYTFQGWSLLPEGYTQVEYIESSGSQRIDTGINPAGKAIGVDATFKINRIVNDRWLFGDIYWNSVKGLSTYQIGIYNNYFIFEMTDSSGNTLIHSEIPADTEKHNLKFNITGQRGSFDGEPLTYLNTINENGNIIDSCNYTLYLFARNGNISGNYYFASQARIYEFKIYDSTELIRYYIPCINNSTGKAGLYDFITGAFYGNTGSGDFTYGNEVNTYITSSSIVNIPRNHTITAKWEPNVYIVTALANGGSIESTSGWTGTGNNATKSVTYDSTYGTLPTVTRAGYTFQGWNGKNLFSGFNKGVAVSFTDGIETITSSGYATSDYISVDFSNDSKYYLSGLSNTLRSCIIIYDNNKNFLGRTSGDFRNEILLDSSTIQAYATFDVNDAKYIRITHYNGDIDEVDDLQVQLEKGSTATPYEPYFLSSSTPVTTARSHSLTAVWESNPYTVTTYANGGTIPTTTGWTGSGNTSTKSVTFGSEYGTLPTPTREGYTFDGWSIVPSEYTPVEYIQSDGNQRLNTGVPGNNSNLGFKVVYSWVTLPSNGGYAAILGSYQSESSVTTRILQYGTGTTYYNINSKAGSSGALYVTREINTVYTETLFSEGNTITYSSNENTVSYTRSSGTNINNTIYLFSHDTYSGSRSSIKLYEAIIYDGNEIIRNFIPCINNSTGKAGLYDLVTGTFYGNSGSGNFTYGNEVTSTITSSSLVSIPRDHTISANWTPNTYTVTANANGGTIPSTSGWTGTGNTATKSVTYDSTYGTLPTPTRIGYTFQGWTNQNNISSGFVGDNHNTLRVYNGTSIQTFNYLYNVNEKIIFDIILSGVGSIDVNDNIVDASNYTKSGNRVYGEIVISQAMRDKYDNYKFIDFNTSQTITDYSINDFRVLTENTTKMQISSDHTLYAIWEANELTFSDQTLNSGTYDTAYTSNAFTAASDGTGSYTYSIVSGAPTGATIDSTNRTIMFTNTTDAGTYNVVVRATDSNSGKTKDATMTIVIDRKEVVFPTCASKSYSSLEQTLYEAHTTGEYTNSALKATNVGSYAVTLTPTSNYKWSSGNDVTSARALTCEITAVERWDGTTEAITPVDDTYEVSNAKQLAWISEQASLGEDFEDCEIVLTDNINMGANFDSNGNLLDNDSHKFTPIESVKADFDGQDYVIYNLYVDETADSKGLFGTYYGKEFKNLTVANSYIRSTGSKSGIIGLAEGTNIQDSSIENIKSINNIIKGIRTGGIAGQITQSTISNCYSSSTIIGTGTCTGGIVGYLKESFAFENINEGPVTGTNYVAGIIGYSNSSNTNNNHNKATITGNNYIAGVVAVCYGSSENNINDGDIIGSATAVGGVVGWVNGGPVSNNINNGTVQGETKWIGGILGISTPGAIISNNKNTGDVKTLKGAIRVGGIIGNANSGAIIINNLNTGDVDGLGNGTANSYGAGGIAGTFGSDVSINDASYLYNNHNYGDVKSGLNAGGIVGNLYNDSSSYAAIKNVINEGTVEATQGYAGGIIGVHDSNTASTYATDFVENAYNKGTVKGTYASGLVGRNIGIKDSITVGTLDGTNNDGVISYADPAVNISNVYYPNTYTSSYGTAIDTSTLTGPTLLNTLGNGFNYTNGVLKLYKANLVIENNEVTSLTYSNDLLEQ